MPFNDTMNTMLPLQNGVLPHVTGNYGENRGSGPHGGTDFNYQGGQAGINLTNPTIHSPINGIVTFVGGEYGTIKIRDTNGNSHEILHTHSQSVTVGQRVNTGDAIGTMGGRGPRGTNQYPQHVHYQMKNPQGHRINPQAWWDNGGNTDSTHVGSNRGSIIVTQESDSGRNERFLDTLSGQEMSREEFVARIHAGEYPDYKVALINGLDTPISKPDGIMENNLG